MKEDWRSDNWHAFFKWGISIGFRLCRKAHKKNKEVTKMKGNKYFFCMAINGCGLKLVFYGKVKEFWRLSDHP